MIKKVYTHSFNGTKYKIEFTYKIEGVTDTPETPTIPGVLLLTGRDFAAFHSAFHESLEASGFCEKCMHDKEGYPRTIDAARLLWRLGYRKRK